MEGNVSEISSGALEICKEGDDCTCFTIALHTTKAGNSSFVG
jgi:hypothetical protein